MQKRSHRMRPAGEEFARRGLRIAAALAIWAAVLTVFMPPPVARAAARLATWGFYVSYDPSSLMSLSGHVRQLDVVVPDYFTVQADGSVSGNDDPRVDRIVRDAGKRLFPLVQNGARYAALDPFLASPAARAATAALLADLVARYGYDGLTLDFEGISPDDRESLTAFIHAVAAALHERGRALAVAIPARSGDLSSGWAGAYDYAAIAGVADRCILMAYAFRTAASREPGPASPLSWIEDVADYAVTRIPANQLLLGVGLWGYDWTVGGQSRAQALRYDQVISLIQAHGGSPSFDTASATAVYRYQQGGQVHEVWYEDATALQEKVAVASRDGLAGIALWRLGQEPPELWASLAAPVRADFAIPSGWFFSETGPGNGLGYRVTDADGVRFWSEFQRLGGVATLGYPSSRRFVGADGLVYQVFQRGILQWRPELGSAVLVNTFDELSAAGQDARLAELGIPSPIRDDGSNGNWLRARDTRLAWLTNPAIASFFRANPNPRAISFWNVDRSIELYGLPTSYPVRSGPFVVQRFQRISLQLWVEAIPGMPPPGSVVGILGGDLYKQAGLIPPGATEP